jgi:hypothetical protein
MILELLYFKYHRAAPFSNARTIVQPSPKLGRRLRKWQPTKTQPIASPSVDTDAEVI